MVEGNFHRKPIFLWITLWLFNIAMENGPFIDDCPIKTSIYKGFSMAMLNSQMVSDLLLGFPATFYFQAILGPQ